MTEDFLDQKEKEFSIFRVLVGVAIGMLILVSFFAGSFYGEEFGLLPIDEPLPEEIAKETEKEEYIPVMEHERAIIGVVEEVSPAVISIVATKDVPIIERHFDVFEDPFGFRFQVPQYEDRGTERREVGGGSGFIISPEGMVLTNRHVVEDESAEYTIFTNEGEKFDAEVIARDPIQDLAIMRIQGEEIFPTVRLGDSSKAIIGQTAIAIGNALGEFKNTVSVGVVSGLDRTISVIEGGRVYTFEGVIQTDAAINRGNSGGPLLNLDGEVIGINTAMVIGAQNIGFSIPINVAKRTIESVVTHGRIVYPFLGVRYFIVDQKVMEENNLPVDYGAWVVGERGEPAVFPGSAAEKAGMKEWDIILEFDGKRISRDNHLARVIVEYDPGDEISLLIMRDGKEMLVEAVLGERSE